MDESGGFLLDGCMHQLIARSLPPIIVDGKKGHLLTWCQYSPTKLSVERDGAVQYDKNQSAMLVLLAAVVGGFISPC